jgi:hypothetical protein
MDLGFSSHAFHSSARLVFLEHTLSADRRTLTISAPPNNRIYPPGPAFLFLTIDDVTSAGVMVMVGNGANPPVADQGVLLSNFEECAIPERIDEVRIVDLNVGMCTEELPFLLG